MPVRTSYLTVPGCEDDRFGACEPTPDYTEDKTRFACTYVALRFVLAGDPHNPLHARKTMPIQGIMSRFVRGYTTAIRLDSRLHCISIATQRDKRDKRDVDLASRIRHTG